MYYCVILGGISVAGKQGTNNKAATTAGTIPTELGNLRAWKYVVFGRYTDTVSLLPRCIIMQHKYISLD